MSSSRRYLCFLSVTKSFSNVFLFLQCDFLYESTEANSFGMVVRGSFESTVVSAFYGRGPADAFFQQYFRMGVQDVLNLYENYVVALEKGIHGSYGVAWPFTDSCSFTVGTRKLYHSEMASEVVRMITQGLRKILSSYYRCSILTLF